MQNSQITVHTIPKTRAMGLLVQGFIFSLLVKSHLFIRVLTTPKMEADEAPADGFSRFINVSTPVLENNSSCHWMSIALEDHGHVWISEHEKKYFEIFLYSNRRYVMIGDNAIPYRFFHS